MGGGETLLLRVFRVLRIFSLIKLGKYSRALRNIFNAISDRKYELIWSLSIAMVVMIFSATVLHITEGGSNPKDFGSVSSCVIVGCCNYYQDRLWWSSS